MLEIIGTMRSCAEFHVAFHDPVIVCFLRLKVVEPKQACKFCQSSSLGTVAGEITLSLPLREAHTAAMDRLMLASTASTIQKHRDDFQVVVAPSSGIHPHGRPASFWHLAAIRNSAGVSATRRSPFGHVMLCGP